LKQGHRLENNNMPISWSQTIVKVFKIGFMNCTSDE